MRDVRKQLVKGLITEINTLIPGRAVYTNIPRSATVAYPYIFINQIFQDEDGPKNKYQYNVECLIQVVYKDPVSLLPLWADMDVLLGIPNNAKKLTLDDGFQVLKASLISSDDTEELNETEKLNIGLVRLTFLIE